MEQLPVGAAQPYGQNDVNSINTGLAGQWAYSPSFVNTKLLAQTSIRLTGSRRADYQAAERNTGTRHTARTTVWHHVYDFNPNTRSCTMQLVSWQDHVSTIPHAGGCRAYIAAYGGRYNRLPPDKEAPAIECGIPACSAKALEEFSLRTGLALSPEMRRLYNGEVRLNQEALSFMAQKDFHLDAILPLWAEEGASVEGIHQLLKERAGASPLKRITAIAVDACGNIFYTDERGAIAFYDHEDDEYLDVNVALRQLME